MRGYVEESPEVKARRALREAAKVYVAKSLVSFVTDVEEASLESAALAYAETRRPRRRARTKREATK